MPKVSREKTINPQMAVGTPSKRKVEVLITTTPYKGVSPNVPAPVIKPSLKSGPAPKKIAAKPKQQTLHQAIPQVLPQLKWIELPTSLTMENASSRFQIREFILRFTSIMEPSIPRSQLAEFDDLGCGPDDDDDENGEMAPWMLVGLEGNALKHVQTALREIRASGNNLSKIWGILAQMRDLTEDQFSFPDPLPLPASATVYNTRTMRSSKELNSGKPLLVIGHTAQMIPVVEALIEVALRTPTVREELEHGFTKAKELTRDVQKAVKEENERWDAERKSLELQKEKDNNRASEIKSKRTAHKMRINDLECALKLVMPAFASRFAPLGTDQVGRTYWVSSPGIVERKAALDFIASTSLSKKAKTQVAESCSSRKWPWFIAVWGKSTRAAGGKGAEADDGAPERWWAFTEPAEIRKAADWIRIDARIDPYAPLELDTNKPLASLVKGLNEYATLLDWRLKVDKYGGFAD
ncbi:hypothetical protein H0H93_005840 [Arthromyces matolae]|nr:hypothetical protein H0H93_005840 [Arthromyces matolae]